MIEEEGTVLKVGLGRALVRTERSTACESCGAHGVCSGLGGGREAQVWVEDPLGVREGERVVVQVPEGAVLRASLLLYLLPVAALVVGAVAGSRLAPALGLSPDLAAAALGLTGLMLAFGLARGLGGRAVRGPRIARKA